MVQVLKSAGDCATPGSVAETVQPPTVADLASKVADLGVVLAYIASRAAAALGLAERAIGEGEIDLVDPLRDCIAAIGCIADMSAASCGEPDLFGGPDGWLGGTQGTPRESLQRLAGQLAQRRAQGAA